MNFRNVTSTDADFIMECLHELAEHEGNTLPLKKDNLLSGLFTENSQAKAFLSIDDDEKPFGLAIWTERFSPYGNGTNLLLIDLYIKPEHRGKGTGALFFEELEKICKNNNYVRIEFFVDTENHRAKNFYTQTGASRLGHSEHWVKKLKF